MTERCEAYSCGQDARYRIESPQAGDTYEFLCEPHMARELAVWADCVADGVELGTPVRITTI